MAQPFTRQATLKWFRFLISASSVCLLLQAPASGQSGAKSCPFNIVGTWKLAGPSSTEPNYVLRFGPDGIATAFNHKSMVPGHVWSEGKKSRYQLDNAKSPKSIRFTPINQPPGAPGADYEITKYDDGSFTQAVTATADVEYSSWVRLDPQRYFVVFAAGKGTPDVGAAAFAMLTKTDGREAKTDSFGLYPTQKGGVVVALGTIPEEIEKELAKEPSAESAAMLRVEVTAGPYQRGLQVMKTWQRRAREGTLPYPYPYLNNAVYLDELANSLNQCAVTIKMYNLSWRFDDPINQRRDLPQVPYQNIRQLRRLNDSIHVKDDEFLRPWHAPSLPPG